MKKKIIFIVNPISGHHNKNHFPNLVESSIDKNKYDYTIVFTEYANHATELTMKAIEDGYEYIAAVGGDGTINEVAKCMIGKEQTLVIIPFGSGNGLARHLGLPFKVEKLIKDVINNGKKYKIDTATMNGVPFISLAGIGFDAMIADYFAKDENRGFLTYAKLITEKYPNYRQKEYTLIMDDKTTIECKPFFVTFANSSQFGYNAEISPKASVQDGLLDVCIFKKPNILEVPIVATYFLAKQIDKSNFIDIYKAKKIQVFRKVDEVANVDGEPVEMSKDIIVEIKPLSLNILLQNN
ncbi:MAG: YegS/Rv2252/BmrU family lipid kinase [Lentimicrobiaceae bacterium]|nr:YegS/Rv2252/BmrU family lipid kinase [Lentimicrobiaceae bacterium]MBQ2908049.1 YegS/Rv2252/BmrU family lipid kinase [Bacteroidales bacterium]